MTISATRSKRPDRIERYPDYQLSIHFDRVQSEKLLQVLRAYNLTLPGDDIVREMIGVIEPLIREGRKDEATG